MKIEDKKIDINLISYIERVYSAGFQAGIRIYYKDGSKEIIYFSTESKMFKEYNKINIAIDKINC